jgi:hypothetical protein
MTTITFTTITKDSPAVGQVTIVGTYANATHQNPLQQTTVLQTPTNNAAWLRFMRLTSAIVQVGRNFSDSVAIYLNSLAQLAYTMEPNLSYPPVITTNPSNASTSFAKATLTVSGTVSDGETVTLGGKTYTFKTALTPTEGEVLIGGSTAAALDNLKLAVNRTDPGSNDGVKYKVAAVHSQVHATTNTDTAQLFEALVVGTAANAYASTETMANGAFGGTTFSGGTAAAAMTIASTSELSGTTYQWQYEDATAKATAVLTSNAVRPANNDSVTIAGTVYTFKTTLSSPAVAYEVLIDGAGGTEAQKAANTLDNLKSAINATAGAGTTYSTGTAANAYVSATTNTDTQQTVEAIVAGEDANAYTLFKNCANLKWNMGTLANGGWASIGGTVNGTVYTNYTTVTLTCTPTVSTHGTAVTGQSGVAHRCTAANSSGVSGSAESTLTIT